MHCLEIIVVYVSKKFLCFGFIETLSCLMQELVNKELNNICLLKYI